VLDWNEWRTYLQIGEGGFPWGSDVRDGRFERNDCNEDFVRLAVAPDCREFVNSVVHAHRSLRDCRATFRHFRGGNVQQVRGLVVFVFVVIYL